MLIGIAINDERHAKGSRYNPKEIGIDVDQCLRLGRTKCGKCLELLPCNRTIDAYGFANLTELGTNCKEFQKYNLLKNNNRIPSKEIIVSSTE